MSRMEDADRLDEIRAGIKELLWEAQEIISAYPGAEARFKGYPYAHIVCALDHDHEFLGRSMFTLSDIADGIRGGGDDE